MLGERALQVGVNLDWIKLYHRNLNLHVIDTIDAIRDNYSVDKGLIVAQDELDILRQEEYYIRQESANKLKLGLSNRNS